MNIAVILAGGTGARIGGELPKQFFLVNHKTIMEYTIEAFEHHPEIDSIYIVCKQEYIDFVKNIVTTNQYSKIAGVIPGGRERYESSIAAIHAIKDCHSNILLHDCARPLVSKRIIHDCIEALKHHEAVSVAVRTTDTIYMSNEKNEIVMIPERSVLRNAQTPQCFRYPIIKKAYESAKSDLQFKPTDDCSVVMKYLPQTPIFIVEGETTNIKITYKEDIKFFEEMLQRKMD